MKPSLRGSLKPKQIKTLRQNNYYPFGLKHKGYNEIAGTGYKYKFGGKELNSELGLELYDFGARNYDAAIGRWLNVDPLTEKFISWSPYNYTYNNPITWIDPTGMGPEHIIIHFKNEEGKNEIFRFDGSNANKAPENAFVQSFLQAYNYNTKNGGGANMKAAAESETNDYHLVEGNSSRSFTEGVSDQMEGRNITSWNTTRGLELDNGDILSPATILEHEFAHSVHRMLFPELHKALIESELREYDNKEEYRVISGPETIQAKLNNELSPGRLQSRTTHRSGDRTKINSVKVEHSTSTKKIKTR